MASESKNDDYAIELEQRNPSDNFGPSSSASSTHSRSPALSATSAADMSSTTSNSLSNNPLLSVFSYCFSSILMTVTNKYVLSGTNFNMNFVLLCVQVR